MCVSLFTSSPETRSLVLKQRHTTTTAGEAAAATTVVVYRMFLINDVRYVDFIGAALWSSKYTWNDGGKDSEGGKMFMVRMCCYQYEGSFFNSNLNLLLQSKQRKENWHIAKTKSVNKTD